MRQRCFAVLVFVALTFALATVRSGCASCGMNWVRGCRRMCQRSASGPRAPLWERGPGWGNGRFSMRPYRKLKDDTRV
jgi:hypothetical protein